MEPQLYQGHSAFRNQPSYKVFNKSFDHADDSLFAFLNELDPEIFREEQQQPTKVFTSYGCRFARQDPRTQEVLGQTVYDHTNEQLPYTFPNPQERYSVLGRAQQSACLRVLLSFQNSTDVDEADFVVWRAVQGKWCNEQQLVQKYIYDYASTQKERLYVPMKPLVQNYNKWFHLRMQHLLSSVLNAGYITHSGLPQLQQCQSLNVNTASMEQVQLLHRTGQVRHWPEVRLHQQHLSTLRLRLERYALAGVANETASDLVAAEVERQLLQVEEDVFVLPLDAMLLLLMPGAYVDLPTEMLLRIHHIANGELKCIEFYEPMPARNCGWHTNNRILAEGYAAYAPAQWLNLTSDGVAELHNEPVKQQAQSQPQPAYKLQQIDDQVHPIKQARSNGALVSWRLQTDEKDDALLIYSSLAIAAVRDTLGEHPLGCHLIKLENKPDCGCEIMTKYELISAWLQLKLLQANVGHCSRISLRDFAPLLEQQLKLEALEEQLYEYYHTSMPQQLCQLHEFLKLLRTVAPGEYLLRYTTKYKDKFLLCRPSLEATAQSFQLHDLLMSKPPTDINFLTQSNSYLPISTKLCSRLHEQLQLLPCAFPAKERGVRATKNKPKIEAKPTLVQRTLKKKEMPKKRKRPQHRQRKREAAKALKQNEKELDKFMCL
ncbi:little elongation complex subunit 2 [Drosophila grimshawi]|uniref:GH17292 n=1 Tax=Drosophila grimshawi TaxID=7222 RepID=B4JUH4_DROGR|nr:little elongation complex subunit 2 [Drosophila grimshawi]EDV91144.1 GH17292 [Drosophila grimshawi]